MSPPSGQSAFCWRWQWTVRWIKFAESEPTQARNNTLCKRSQALKYCPLEVPETGIFLSHKQRDFLGNLRQFLLENSVISVYAQPRQSLCWQFKLAFSYSCLTYPLREQLIASFFRLLCRTILVLHIVINTQAAWLRFVIYYLCCLCNTNSAVHTPLEKSGITFHTKNLQTGCKQYILEHLLWIRYYIFC